MLGQIWAYSKDAFLREHKKVTNGGKTSLKYYEQMKWYLPYSKAGGPLSQPDGQQEARSDDDDDDDTAADAPMAPPAIGSDKQPTASGSQQQQMELVYEYPVRLGTVRYGSVQYGTDGYSSQ